MRTTAILVILAAAVACGPCGCGPIDVSITTGEGSESTDPTTGEPMTTGSTGLGASESGEPATSTSTGSTSTGEGSSGEESSEATSTGAGSSSGEATSSGSDTGDECVPGLPCWCDDLEPPQPCPAATNPFDASCSCYIAGPDCVCPSATVDAALCQPC